MTTTANLRAHLAAHGVDGPPIESGWYVALFIGGEVGIVFCDGRGGIAGAGTAAASWVVKAGREMSIVDGERAARCGSFFAYNIASHAPLSIATTDVSAEVARLQSELDALHARHNETINALVGMVAQHCAYGDDLDSMALTANCEAMELLASLGRVVLHGPAVGRRAIGRWPKSTREEEAAQVEIDRKVEAERAERVDAAFDRWRAHIETMYDRASLMVVPAGGGRFVLELNHPEGGGESAFRGLSASATIALADGSVVHLAGARGREPCEVCGA